MLYTSFFVIIIMVTTMSIFKVIKSKYYNYKEEEAQADLLRAEGDITQFFKDTSDRRMLDIQSTIITDLHTYTKRGKAGRHSMLEASMIGEISSNRISRMHGYFAQLIARELGYVVMEFAGFINGGLITIFAPEKLNEYQISEIERINNEIKVWNSQVTDQCFKATPLIIDPELHQETVNIDEVLRKYKDKLTVNSQDKTL